MSSYFSLCILAKDLGRERLAPIMQNNIVVQPKGAQKIHTLRRKATMVIRKLQPFGESIRSSGFGIIMACQWVWTRLMAFRPQACGQRRFPRVCAPG